MSDVESLTQQAQVWLEPLSGDDGPCGVDLEYDNAFLELARAAEGKPETQFERAVPPDWRAVRTQAEALFERTRDLRIALQWLRAVVNLEGVAAFEPALNLAIGLLQTHWDTVHPLPDPEDNDPYARANALAQLPRLEQVLGDLLHARLLHVKGVGEVKLRDCEVALGQMSAREDETTYSREQLERMFVSADEEGAGLREMVLRAQQSLRALGNLMNERFGAGSHSELKPLVDLFAHALSLMPEPQAADTGDGDGGDGGDGAGRAEGDAQKASKAGLSGSVNSRAEALKAIELVCAYLERHEPTNPAQLFLRRASNLLERNFLELLKELAPNALDEVARIVGVDPNTVGEQPE